MRRITLLLSLALCGCPTSGGSDDDDSADDNLPALDVITSEERPTKRSEFLAVADDPTNSIVVFGGNMGPVINQIPYAEYTGETWIFEPGVGWTELNVEGPSERGRFGVGYDPSGRMLLFAGRWRLPETSGNYTLYDDLWAFDFASQSWTELEDGGGPSGRYHAGTVWSTEDDALYVWGGATNTNALVLNPSNDFWVWTDEDGWSERSTSGTGPSTRVFFGTTYDPVRNRMIVYAGQVGDFQSAAYNDLYALDLSTSTWTQLHDGSGFAPDTRMHPHLIYDTDRDRYLMWGGHRDVGDGNDLWAFDPESDTWELIYEGDTFTGVGVGCGNNPSEVPADYVDQDLSAPERRHRAMIAEMHDNLWIFGGMHAECSDHLDDTWRYDLGSNEWHELIEARAGESCLRRADDCKCLCL
jgi:hypothetical protein